MSEKLKTNISNELYSVLKLDAELFEFYHRNGDINMNRFLNHVILHTYREFDKKREERFIEVHKILIKSLGYHGISDIELQNTAWDVTTDYFDSDGYKNEKVVRLTTTHEYDDEVFSDKYLKDGTQPPSSYLRSILIYYRNKPRYERERIIFSHVYNTLIEAIREKRAVDIRLNIRTDTFSVIPYSIVYSKEEFYNYLICVEIKDGIPTIFSIRLMRIVSVIKKGPAVIEGNLIPLLEKTIDQGPMFAINDDNEISVELTKEGVQRYKNSAIHRPVYTRTEGNVYYFDCSPVQIIHYFFSFGEHAKILSPESLQKQFKTLYEKGLSKYK